MNNFNVFNQIGLIALNCIGSNNLETPQTPVLAKRPTQQINNDESLDPETASKLRALEQIKESAVSQERFDDAKKVKEAIDRIRSLAMHM